MFVQGVIFDVDGVIADTEYYFTNSCAAFLKSQGIDVTWNDIVRYLGQPEMVVVRAIQKDYDLYRYDEQELFHLLYKQYDEQMASGMVKPMEGLEEFLDRLQEAGVKTALGTSGSIPHVQQILNGIRLKDRFDIWITVENVSKGKPDPEIFNKAADALCSLGCERNRIAVIEDSPNGIKAGRAAGLLTIGFAGSVIPQDTSMADRQCRSFAEVLQLLEKEGE